MVAKCKTTANSDFKLLLLLVASKLYILNMVQGRNEHLHIEFKL